MNHRILGIVTEVMVMSIIVSIILLFVGIGVLVLIHICVMGSAIMRVLNSIAVERNNGLSNGMNKHDLEKLPCFRYESGGEKESPDPYAVCLEGYQKGDWCRLLPNCKHSFHAQCVGAWLMKVPICPICRTGINPNEVNNLKDGRNHYDDDMGTTQTFNWNSDEF